jgi:hypothetical protein
MMATIRAYSTAVTPCSRGVPDVSTRTGPPWISLEAMPAGGSCAGPAGMTRLCYGPLDGVGQSGEPPGPEMQLAVSSKAVETFWNRK